MAKKRGLRTIGIDYGMARIGLSYSDEMGMIAMSMKTMEASKKAEDTVKKLFVELKAHSELLGYDIKEIVIGLPLLLSGKVGLLADEVKNFVELMKKETTVPIHLWDERLTSVQAERSLMESSMTRRARSKAVDGVAAVIILQNFLDSRSFGAPSF